MMCRSCNSTKIVDIASFGDQHISDFINKGDTLPPKYPLDLVLCKDCSLLQLKESTPTIQLYTDRYGYRSGINETMKRELHEIVQESINHVDIKEGDVVLDIGANDGTLLSNYQNVTRIAVDPIKKFTDEITENKRAEIVVNDFFNLASYGKVCNKRAKIITAISMFYDLDDPNAFVRDLTKVLHKDGILVIQQNYLGTMIENLAVDNVCHEHVEYYSLTSLEKLLNRHGLEVVDVQMSALNGGSFRTFVKHMDNVKKLRLIERKMKLDKVGPYLLFGMKIGSWKHKLRAKIESLVKDGKTVYVLGASTRGNTLMQVCGFDHKLIKAAIERNSEKFGKYYGGTGIPIISEKQARKEKPDYVLVLPWFFRDEIIKREHEYLESGGHLIFPLPELEVV